MASTNAPTVAQLEALSLKVTAATAAAGLGAASGARGLGLKSVVAKLSVALLIGGTATWLATRESPQSGRTGAPDSRTAAPARELAPSNESARTSTRRQVQPVPTMQRADLPSGETARASTSPVTEAQPPAVHQLAAPARTQRARATAHHTAPAGEESAPEHVGAEHAASDEPASASGSTTPPKTSDTPSELTLLGRAQSAMARDPRAALAALEQHAQAYPHGAFAEEREALAIDALRRLGRDRDMHARTQMFLQRYPASAHRERIEAALR